MISIVRFIDSSRDKEHEDAQFLQIGVSMAKLQPLLNHCKFFMKCAFVLSFYNALYCRFLYVPLCRVFANRVTYEARIYKKIFMESFCGTLEKRAIFSCFQ